MKIFLAGILLLAAFCAQAAKTVYVTDQFEIQLRRGQGTQYKILSELVSGTPLIVLKNDQGNGWTYVKTEAKTTGWVLTRYLTEFPVARAQIETATHNLETLQQENQQTKEELSVLKANQQETLVESEQLIKEKNRLIQELSLIRQASSNAVQIMEERDQLQERVINLERDLQNIKRENQTLEDSTKQDWFLVGAGVLFGGIFLGLILPKLSWKRKTRSWDSF